MKFVLSVLGLTGQNLRGRIVRVIGEPATAALETTVSVVRTLITEGPAAAWEQIREMLGNLRDMLMTQIMQYVSTTIVQAAMTRLLTSLNPVGAFIQAIIAIYNTIMFLIERISQIMQVGRSVLDGIMAIAAGAITPLRNGWNKQWPGCLPWSSVSLLALLGWAASRTPCGASSSASASRLTGHWTGW
ncbi:MAG: hypothetical protein IPM82_25970 [Saprospiraceae bacterium]|nr:hypothetical protein [Saprospiraceae bacterium]